jgi:hypothetical protein
LCRYFPPNFGAYFARHNAGPVVRDLLLGFSFAEDLTNRALLGEYFPLMKLLALAPCLLVAFAVAAPDVVARVQDGETRQPLAGVMVLSEGSDIMAITDSGGQCMVVSVPKKGGHLLFSRTGYFDQRRAWTPPAKPVPETVIVDLSLYPDRPRLVTGRVFDAGTKLTIAGARVSVAGANLAESTRADGGFILSRFPPGPQTLEVSSPGYPLKSLALQVKSGETSSVDLYLLDTANVGSVEGTVFDAGTSKPVPDARVTVEGTGCAAVTDSAGRYVMENVPAGMNKMLVSHDGYLKAYTVVRLVKDWAVTANLYLRKTASKSTSGK